MCGSLITCVCVPLSHVPRKIEENINVSPVSVSDELDVAEGPDASEKKEARARQNSRETTHMERGFAHMTKRDAGNTKSRPDICC